LVARHLEANGLPTVIVGSARDIVTHCGVPRFLFTDFPLGNPAGHPGRPDMQRATVAQALRMFETAHSPRTIETAPYAWHEGEIWRARYGHIDPAEIARLRAEGDQRRRRQDEAKALKTSQPRNG
jgi:hypothetical protein